MSTLAFSLVHHCPVLQFQSPLTRLFGRKDDVEVLNLASHKKFYARVDDRWFFSTAKTSLPVVDVWNSLSDAVVKSTSVASLKTNLSTADLSRFLTIV